MSCSAPGYRRLLINRVPFYFSFPTVDTVLCHPDPQLRTEASIPQPNCQEHWWLTAHSWGSPCGEALFRRNHIKTGQCRAINSWVPFLCWGYLWRATQASTLPVAFVVTARWFSFPLTYLVSFPSLLTDIVPMSTPIHKSVVPQNPFCREFNLRHSSFTPRFMRLLVLEWDNASQIPSIIVIVE